MQRVSIAIAILLPMTLTTVAALLFWKQGGYGGGHGEYDQSILFLTMPGRLIAGLVPQLWMEQLGDVAAILALPAIINVLLCICIASLAIKALEKRYNRDTSQ